MDDRPEGLRHHGRKAVRRQGDELLVRLARGGGGVERNERIDAEQQLRPFAQGHRSVQGLHQGPIDVMAAPRSRQAGKGPAEPSSPEPQGKSARHPSRSNRKPPLCRRRDRSRPGTICVSARGSRWSAPARRRASRDRRRRPGCRADRSAGRRPDAAGTPRGRPKRDGPDRLAPPRRQGPERRTSGGRIRRTPAAKGHRVRRDHPLPRSR